MKDKSIKQHWPLSARLTVLIMAWLWMLTAILAFLFHGKYEAEAMSNRILIKRVTYDPETEMVIRTSDYIRPVNRDGY